MLFAVFAKRSLVATVLFCVLIAGGAGGVMAEKSVVVTTTMLESAVWEATGDRVRPERLIPPGNCPGHFDLKPLMLKEIKNSDLFICHDYQRGIKDKVEALGGDLDIMVVAEKGSYLVPSNYWNMVEQIEFKLNPSTGVGDVPGAESDSDSEGRDIPDRMETSVRLLRTAAAENGWRGASVLAAAMQADFCRWLGFDVAGVIPRSEALTPSKMRDLLRTDAEMVVGNLQSGGDVARIVGQRLDIPVAVISNFPRTAASASKAYENLLQDNIEELERAWEAR